MVRGAVFSGGHRHGVRLPRTQKPAQAALSRCVSISLHRLSASRQVSGSAAAVDVPKGMSDGAEEPELEYGLACAQGPRGTMEDELCVIPGFGEQMYAAVFDGHGGSAAAQWLHDNLQDFVLAAVNQSANPMVAVQAAFEAADAELLHYLESASKDGKLLTGAGATATVMLADLEKLVIGNVGDSTAVLVRDGKPIHLTSAHRVWGKTKIEEEEIARVKAAGGWVGDGRVCEVLAVSRAFGDWEFKGSNSSTLLEEGIKFEWWDRAFADEVNITGELVVASPSVSVTDIGEDLGDEFVVIASDGLWDFYNERDALQFARNALSAGQSAQQVADGLVDRALKRYTADNVSIIVIRFPWALKSDSRGVRRKPSRSKKKLFGVL